jgi:quercetin dioxygenase-like cupin family protein
MSPRFEEFRQAAMAAGFDEVLQREWPANAVIETHTHPFRAKALVVQGEMWLTIDGVTQHLLSGSEFELAREQAHAERYGAAGATYWVARQH